MNIIQIKHIYDELPITIAHDDYINKNVNCKNKECRLIVYNSLEEIVSHIERDTREWYSDKYLSGILCPIFSEIMFEDIQEDEVTFIIRLWNGEFMLNRFIKIL